MGINAFADRGVTSNLGDTRILHQDLRISTTDVVHSKVRQVDHAGIVRHGKVLGIGYSPEMPIVPFVFTNRHLVGVLLQQMLVGGIAMGALPASELHKVAA